MLDMQMGLGANNKFLTRILFTANACLVTVPNLLKIFLTKALHMHFGKYSMFSDYSSTVNCSMFWLQVDDLSEIIANALNDLEYIFHEKAIMDTTCQIFMEWQNERLYNYMV